MTTRSPETAELVCALSLASDLGMGQPMEHGFRACLVALRLADALGMSEVERHDVYYLALLRWVGCTAHAHELSVWFEDELAAHARLFRFDPADPRQLAADLLRHAGAGRPAGQHLRALLNALTTAPRAVPAMLRASCEVAQGLCAPLGMPESLVRDLGQVFERWDGRGIPAGLRARDIDLAVRVVQLAHTAAAHSRRGLDAAVGACEQRAGRELDPTLVDLLGTLGPEAYPDEVSATAVLAAEPRPAAPRPADRPDDALAAVADFADLKSPWLSGHSRAVASLAAAAVTIAGLPPRDADAVRNAGYLHDLGRTAVPGAIWDRTCHLSEADWEQVRLHPYWTERILTRLPSLRPLAELAGQHHERSDRSGYHRSIAPAAFTAQVLAAADVYAALTADRPHRQAFADRDATAVLRTEVGAGRLSGHAVDAVLTAAGQSGRRHKPRLPAGLTGREVEVLILLSRGLTNRQVASALHVSERTVAHHVQHIYGKAGVSTRAAATLFALQHGLLAPEYGQHAR